MQRDEELEALPKDSLIERLHRERARSTKYQKAAQEAKAALQNATDELKSLRAWERKARAVLSEMGAQAQSLARPAKPRLVKRTKESREVAPVPQRPIDDNLRRMLPDYRAFDGYHGGD